MSKPTAAAGPDAGRSPLAGLWALDPTGRAAGIASPREMPPYANGTLRLGGGAHILTSGGVAVELPASSQERDACLARLESWAYMVLSETYPPSRGAVPGWAFRAYYAARPLLPRSLQLMLRRRHARGRAVQAFLSWPIDGLYVALAETYLSLRIELSGCASLEVPRLWPAGRSAGATLTHDVEGTEGQARCRSLAALEEARGFRSAFNFVAERYSLDRALMDELRARGFEIGLHGIKHDGKKFSSRRLFEDRLAALARYRDEWQIEGFRSPATHRRWEWMAELPFGYDSSYPDTDPFEPMAGGCGSPWPFWFGNMVELPITMPQDHTAWEILRQSALPLWRSKAAWLRRCRGLINIVVHPDYLTTAQRWKEYEMFLDDLRATSDVWVELPSTVARWWRHRRSFRESVRLEQAGGDWALAFGSAPA